MKLVGECFEDVRKQAEQTLDLIYGKSIEAPGGIRTRALAEVESFLQALPEQLTPAELAFRVQKIIEARTGIPDPYRSVRQNRNRVALEMEPVLREELARASDPLQTAALWAVLASGLDYENASSPCDLLAELHRLSAAGFARSDFEAFRGDLTQSRSLLYLAAGAGEIIFDRLLIETLKKEYPAIDITVAVRRIPLHCDALREEAREAGLELLGEIVDQGCEAAGTLLSQANEEFQLVFSTSDIVISKGLANYQTLRERPDIIYFALRVRCRAAEEGLRVPPGSSVFVRSF